jgi:hypothetical protein
MRPIMAMGGFRAVGAAAFFAMLAAGCGGDESSSQEPPVPRVPAPVHQAESAGPGSGNSPASESGLSVLKVGPFNKQFEGIEFSVPEGWKEVALSPQQRGFIDARFQIPTPHGEVSLTCSSNSGGIETNVQRWIGQFQLPPDSKPDVESLPVDGKTATWIDLRGEFAPGPMPGSGTSGPVERMLGVGIPLGSRDFYLKLTGTDAAVGDIRAAFRKFVRDAKLHP